MYLAQRLIDLPVVTASGRVGHCTGLVDLISGRLEISFPGPFRGAGRPRWVKLSECGVDPSMWGGQSPTHSQES